MEYSPESSSTTAALVLLSNPAGFNPFDRIVTVADRFKIDHPFIPGGLLLLAVALFTFTNLLNPLDRLIYDSIIRHAGVPSPKDIVIVSIDQKSLNEIGRWPWRRITHARLLERLTQAKPKAVAFDVAFAEPDNLHPEDDEALAAAIGANGRVVLPILLEEGAQGLPLRETKPVAMFAKASAALGHVDTELDADGVVRSAFLLAGLGEPRWPTLALALARVGGEDLPDPLPGERAPGTQLPGNDVWRRDHRILVPFSGPSGHIRQISYTDVLAGKVSASEITGRYVFIGATAAGLGDQIPTPVSAQSKPLSGVEFNAEVFRSLLRNLYILEIGQTPRFVLNLLVTLGLCFLFYRLLVGFMLGILFSGILLIATSSYILLAQFHHWYPPSALLLVLILGFSLFNWRHLKTVLKKLLLAHLDNQATLNSGTESIIKTTAEGMVLEMNHNAEQMLALNFKEVKDRLITDVVKLRRDFNSPALKVADIFADQFQGGGEQLILTNWRQEKTPVRLVCGELPAMDGRAKGNIIVFSDLTREKRLAKKLKHQSTHNPVTGLPNRNLMRDKLTDKLKQAEQTGTQVAIVQVNLDQFGRINQTLGYNKGNLVLKAAAKLLGRTDEYQITLGHPSADEFIIIVEGIQDQSPITALITRVQDQLAEPITLDGQNLSLTACIGISLFPDDNIHADMLIRQADIAVHKAKEYGSNQVVFFSSGMQIKAARQIEIQQFVLQSLESENILTLYQPIVKADDGRIVAVEALMRIIDQNGNYVSPIEFIPVAEKSGQIADLGIIQLRQACRDQMFWNRLNMPILRLSLNLSPRQLMNTELARQLKEIISSANFPPTEIEFEITENLLLEEEDYISTLFAELRQFGAEIALDDFGTGYNSMQYLRGGNFSRLKIDMSFVRDLGTKPGASAITVAIIDMAHSLGMKVIAEGVETFEQLEILRQQGCDELQGYYFSKPLKMLDFIEYYQKTGGFAPADN